MIGLVGALVITAAAAQEADEQERRVRAGAGRHRALFQVQKDFYLLALRSHNPYCEMTDASNPKRPLAFPQAHEGKIFIRKGSFLSYECYEKSAAEKQSASNK